MKRKKFFAFIKNNWGSAIMLTLAAASALVGLFWPDDKFSVKALSIAVALIAGDLFLLIGQYLEAIRDAVSGNAKGPQLIGRTFNTRRQMVAEAKKDLFFSGPTLPNLIILESELLNLSEQVHVRLLAMDIEDEAVMKNYVATFGQDLSLSSLKHLNRYLEKVNFEIRTVKFPLIVHISARDIDAANGLIHLTLPEYGNVTTNSPRVNIVPTDIEWYNFYKNQIELLWAQGAPWSPPLKAGTP